MAEDRALELVRRYSVAKALESVVDPLSKNGVDVFQIKNKGIVEAAISKDDASAFLSVSPDAIDGEKLSDNTVDTPFEVVTASSSPEYIWRLSDGSGVINVHIEDKQFYSDIQRGVKTISLGDTLFVTIRSVTISENGRLKTTHTVSKVLKHLPSRNINDSPPELPFDEEDNL